MTDKINIVGYGLYIIGGKVYNSEHQELISGREWYDRFVREYHNKADWIAGDPVMGDDAEHDVLLAAKLASNL
jgi:hypothetical protein